MRRYRNACVYTVRTQLGFPRSPLKLFNLVFLYVPSQLQRAFFFFAVVIYFLGKRFHLHLKWLPVHWNIICYSWQIDTTATTSTICAKNRAKIELKRLRPELHHDLQLLNVQLSTWSESDSIYL